MDVQALEWLNLFLRWFHVIAAIAWIGASFYFVWLDCSLETPPDSKLKQGIKGDLWAIHGGGIYEVAKYRLAPQQMPKNLHWFMWESYTTWITGTLLLIIFYYFKADLYLVDSSKWLKSAPEAIAASAVFLFSGVAFYELVFRKFALRNDRLLAGLIATFICIASYLSAQLFSDRASFLLVGAMIATIMSANVFLGIIPAQRDFISALNRDEEPDEFTMLRAKRRSLQNNYFTLPVIFCMISNHYAFLYGHPLNWIILIFIMGITAYVRHYFNLKHTGKERPIILVIATIATLLFAIGISFFSHSAKQSTHVEPAAAAKEINEDKPLNSSMELVADKDEHKVLSLVLTHCAGCHAKAPTAPGFTAPPAGLVFDSIDSLKNAKPTVITSIQTRYMPLGNMTNMSEEERVFILEAVQSL